MIEKTCVICGSTYKIFPSQVKISKYCSRNCTHKGLSQQYKNRKLTPEWLSNMNESKRRENVVKFGEYTCSTCNKKFDNNLSLRSHASYCNSSTVKPEIISCRICGKTFNSRSIKSHLNYHNPEWVKKHSNAVKKSLSERKLQKRISVEELNFYEKLKTVYGSAEETKHSVYVDGINHEFDFFIPSKNLLIEFDGDYWHGNCQKRKLTKKMKQQYKIDKSYTKAAEKLGYTVHRVWSSESHLYPNRLRTI